MGRIDEEQEAEILTKKKIGNVHSFCLERGLIIASEDVDETGPFRDAALST